MIYSYINTRENWKNSKLCENTPPCGRRVSTQFLVFPISTRVDITVYQHGKCFIFLKYNMRIIIYKLQHFIFITVSEEIRSAVTSLSPRRTIFLGNSPSTETDFLGISPHQEFRPPLYYRSLHGMSKFKDFFSCVFHSPPGFRNLKKQERFQKMVSAKCTEYKYTSTKNGCTPPPSKMFKCS